MTVTPDFRHPAETAAGQIRPDKDALSEYHPILSFPGLGVNRRIRRSVRENSAGNPGNLKALRRPNGHNIAAVFCLINQLAAGKNPRFCP